MYIHITYIYVYTLYSIRIYSILYTHVYTFLSALERNKRPTTYVGGGADPYNLHTTSIYSAYTQPVVYIRMHGRKRCADPLGF